MPRDKTINLKRPITNISKISLAIEDIEKGLTIETAAKKHTIAKTTLWRHYKRHQLSYQQTCVYVKGLENINQQIFTDEEEIFLAEYIKTLAALQYGLYDDDVRKFVYLIAQKNRKNIPRSWIEEKQADIEWLAEFVKRHPSIPLKQLKDLSIFRAFATYQPKIDFNVIPNNLKDSLSLYLFTQIYHLMNLVNTVNPSKNEKSSENIVTKRPIH